MIRLYVPASFEELARFHADGGVPTGEAVGAVDTTEEAEYDALMEAAALSAERAARTGDPRRVVIAVDVTTPGLTAPIADVASVHVDPVPGAEPDDDLAWYARQEIDQLLPAAE